MMIRQMQSDDIDAIMKIWLAGNLEAHAFVGASYWYDHLSAVRSAIQNAETYCAVGEGGTIAGFIGLTGNYLAGLFVAKQYHQHGIGSQLLRYAQQKHGQLTLDAYPENQSAIAFYHRHGFIITQQDGEHVRMAWPAK